MNSSDLRIADHPARAAANAADFTFEPLNPQARGEILTHLGQLSPADLNLRFSATMTEAALARYTANLDFNRDSFVAARARSGELTGLAQVMPIGSDQGAAAEVAFSLVRAARGVWWSSRNPDAVVACEGRNFLPRIVGADSPDARHADGRGNSYRADCRTRAQLGADAGQYASRCSGDRRIMQPT